MFGLILRLGFFVFTDILIEIIFQFDKLRLVGATAGDIKARRPLRDH